MCMVIEIRAAYKKPFPIATIKASSLGLSLILCMIIALTNIRMVVATNSAMHPRRLLMKTLGVQN